MISLVALRFHDRVRRLGWLCLWLTVKHAMRLWLIPRASDKREQRSRRVRRDSAVAEADGRVDMKSFIAASERLVAAPRMCACPNGHALRDQ